MRQEATATSAPTTTLPQNTALESLKAACSCVKVPPGPIESITNRVRLVTVNSLD